ncbi:glycosyltransferase family 1 protein [Sporolactobacillus vineae]|uniref:glycosyltransferase family 1 protein n=1 Tax=Sporolactobacillus vineae TaxID=444463 RepID=UPI0002889E25|nr:glycosyltransferase family 1 protein [Sporolactobacillus vineae]
MKPVATGFQDIRTGDVHDYDNIIQYFNFRQADQKLPHRPHSITFVTTGIIPYDGGQTTMLHLGTELSKHGFDVYYLSYVRQTREEMETNAAFNYSGYKGTCLDASALEHHQSDIWIATMWESVYVLKDRPGYKMYFVQDYEPYFYAYGDRHYLAKKTYELGLHMVSLGPWCAEMIQKNCRVRSPLDVVNFPVDSDQYTYRPRNFMDYHTKKEFTIAAYTKWNSPRRAPISLQIVLKNWTRIAREQGYKLNIVYFGTDRSARFLSGTNLGKLTKKEMEALYLRSDFGIAPSMTNFSLVPYEMMDAGLPVIDFYEGTGRSFIAEDCALYCHLDALSISRTFLDAVRDPVRIRNSVHNARRHLTSVTWKKTISDFMEIVASLQTPANV